jgi:predicted  nucleic acid-binding Zn-ribbon protein
MDCKACQQYVSLVSAQQQELLLFQQHADDLVAAATAEINVCRDELDREQEEHEKTKAELQASKAELAKLQTQLGKLLPSLQPLTQQLKVRQLLLHMAWHTLATVLGYSNHQHTLS